MLVSKSLIYNDEIMFAFNPHTYACYITVSVGVV